MRRLSISTLVIFIVSFVFISQQLLAQECLPLIEETFNTIVEACQGLGPESACAGNSSSTDNDALSFANPGDVVSLSELNWISTGSEDASNYGLTMLTVYANVPLALSNTGLHYLLLGDATIENRSAIDTAYVPQEAIDVVTIVGSNLRAAPSTEGRVIAGATPGTELSAYGLSSDQQWLLALFEDSSVWISRQVVSVQGEGNLNDLPVIRGNERSWMQSFHLTTASTTPDCLGTPASMLVIQGPEGFGSEIEVNGIEIRFTSTIVLRITADQQLQLLVLNGGAVSNNLSVPAGFTMFIPLDSEGMASGGWTGFRPIRGEERFLFLPLESLPQGEWYTAITIPTDAQIAETLASLNSASIGQTTTGPAAGRAQCSNFRPTSPLQAMGNRPDQAFYWDGASGATSYRLNIYNESGNPVGTVEISSNSTTAITDTTPNSIGNGGTFGWEVQALVDGQVACTTGRAIVIRDAVPVTVGTGSGGGPRPTATPCNWGSC